MHHRFLRASAALFACALPFCANAATYTVTNTNDAGAGSLRAALLSANGNAGLDFINFNIPGAGEKVISPLTSLPAASATAAVYINGFSQPGFTTVPLIRLDGVNLPDNASGLTLSAPSSTIRGLKFTRFGTGVLIYGDNADIYGSWFGTDGTVALGNNAGIRLLADAAAIGGTLATSRCVFSGNGTGIYLDPGFSGTTIVNSYFGLNPAGTAAIPNENTGIRSFADDVIIGGTLATQRNVISGNGYGIGIEAGTLATVYNNYIGTNAAGTAAVPNGVGIGVSGGSDHNIGGSVAGTGNLISGNTGTGIYVGGNASLVRIRGNRVGTDAAGNAALPNGYGMDVHGSDIDIGGNGVGNHVAGNLETGISVAASASLVRVLGNRVGINAAGNAVLPNDQGIVAYGTSVEIGGSVPGTGNVISGNVDTGVYVGGTASLVRVRGNRIGTNEAGTAALSNGQYGVQVHGTDVDVGGSQGALNVISGNGRDGIGVGASAGHVFIFNNRIGTNLAGTAAIPNVEEGISVGGTDIHIGPLMNLISGNGGNGISVHSVDGVEITNNRIGTDLAGMAALPNGGYGIRVLAGSGVQIGLPNAGNLVSGNARSLSLENGGNIVQGNTIGLNADETAALGNGEGIDLSSSDNLFGGTGAGEGNVVAGNDGGVSVSAGGMHNVIQGNFLGSNRLGTFVPGNGYSSMQIYEGFDTLVGGTQPGAGNVIAGNYAAGIFTRVGKRNSFLGNSIHSNELSGIDNEPVGPSPNDPLDTDQGPNENQNRPVVRSAIASNNQIAIVGELRSAPGLSYRVEFFHNAACHESGLGEGRTFLGFAEVATQADGTGAIVTSLASNLSSGFVTATATAPDGNTSEFSPCIAMGVPGNGKFTFWRNPGLSYEDHQKVEISVVRSEGLEGTVSVSFATVPDSATAPADYTHTAQVLTFGPGEWLRTVTVPLKLDNDVEGDQEFKVTLANPTGGATVGTAEATYILFDHEQSYPFLLVNNVSLDEPASGQAVATFDVTLTSTDHAVVVDYETMAETATAGADFQAKSGTLTFPASATTTTLKVSVPIYADDVDETDETFRLDVHGNSGTFIASETVGEAIIRDDSAPIAGIFADGFE